MGQIFEAGMLFIFGLSWPFNIMKSWRSRTARGKSIGFEVLILIGYLLGLTGKILNGNITYVVIVYALDIVMVAADLLLTIRNAMLDKASSRE